MSRFCLHCMEELNAGDRCSHCGKLQSQTEAAPDQLKPGSILWNRYLIGEAIGRGGFGITYIGRDLTLGWKIAVKEYYPCGLAYRYTEESPTVTVSRNEDIYERGKEKFLEEAQSLAQFSGEPGVAEIKDFFRANNTAYIVMRCLEGHSLKEEIGMKGVMPFRTIFSLLGPVFDSLEKIHSTGMIHRDISPENIFLSNTGVKLIDFGAARDFTRSEATFSIILKDGYAPKEQYLRHGHQGPWTDEYALCATIYRCITGKKPCSALNRMTASDPLVKPRELGADISPAEEAVLLKGMAPDMQDRYRSVAEFRTAVLRAEETGAGNRIAEEEEKTVNLTEAPEERTRSAAEAPADGIWDTAAEPEDRTQNTAAEPADRTQSTSAEPKNGIWNTTAAPADRGRVMAGVPENAMLNTAGTPEAAAESAAVMSDAGTGDGKASGASQDISKIMEDRAREAMAESSPAHAGRKTGRRKTERKTKQHPAGRRVAKIAGIVLLCAVLLGSLFVALKNYVVVKSKTGDNGIVFGYNIFNDRIKTTTYKTNSSEVDSTVERRYYIYQPGYIDYHYNADHKLSEYYASRFNLAGKLLSVTNYSSEHKLIGYDRYTYDSSGKCSQITKYDNNSDKTSEIIYDTGTGHEVRETIYDSDGQVSAYMVLEYNEYGVSQAIYYDSDGTEELHEVWEYNADGTVKNAKFYNPDGSEWK